MEKSNILLEKEKSRRKFSRKIKSFLRNFHLFNTNTKTLNTPHNENNYDNIINNNSIFFYDLEDNVNSQMEIFNFQREREKSQKS